MSAPRSRASEYCQRGRRRDKSYLDIAREILAAAQADIRGTRGESYFTIDRGVTLTPWPACLHFAPKLQHPCEQFFPAARSTKDVESSR
jgi:hypothetical protein